MTHKPADMLAGGQSDDNESLIVAVPFDAGPALVPAADVGRVYMRVEALEIGIAEAAEQLEVTARRLREMLRAPIGAATGRLPRR